MLCSLLLCFTCSWISMPRLTMMVVTRR
ncbi:hypothetical protein LINPERHAP1_LOCUS32362 [Linum perenne]